VNAIAKAVYSGTLIRDLEDAAERLLRKNSSWHRLFFDRGISPKEPWSIVASARMHLADAAMTSGDVEAYKHLGWVQDRLFNAANGTCSTEYSTERGMHSFCGKPSVTFCGSCGCELCLDCAQKCCMETFCEFCQAAHEREMQCDA
jgi:hypothetical protein